MIKRIFIQNFIMRFLFFVLIALLLSGCKPYQNTLMKDAQITYTGFRQSQQKFNSSEGSIAYIDKGNGPVIVLLHGVPTSGWLYRHMIDPLVDQGYRVIVPDMLGFGSSSSPKGYEIYSEKKHAQRLLALMEHLHIKSWTHLMHDAGGLWTWELAKIAPQKIERLIILNTIINEEGFKPPVRFKPGFIARTAMWGYRNGITTNMMLKSLFKEGLTHNTLNKEDIEGYKRPLLEGKTKGMYYFFSQTCNTLPNYRNTIQKLKVPTLVIWGKNDTFLSWSSQENKVIQDLNISKDNIHLLEAKHFIQEEQPEKIVALIQSFKTIH